MGKKAKEKAPGPIDIGALQDQVVSLTPLDTMGEAGRKILLNSFVRMLEREAGTRTGQDIEDLHRMRVATRHMRSAFKLFTPYFKKKTVQPFVETLKTLAGVLGVVRDLDVMIDDLTDHQSTLDDKGKDAFQKVIARLDKKRVKARKKLIAYLDSNQYQMFCHEFGMFLTKSGSGLRSRKPKGPAPFQVRHVIPGVIHQHLATVRAYDTVVDNAKLKTLHALRIEYKRLRYTIAHFSDVLGKSSQGFITDIKVMQDYLGRLNDISVAQPFLATILSDDSLTDSNRTVLEGYLTALADEETQGVAGFRDVWDRFNSRTVQRKLSDSLLILR